MNLTIHRSHICRMDPSSHRCRIHNIIAVDAPHPITSGIGGEGSEAGAAVIVWSRWRGCSGSWGTQLCLAGSWSCSCCERFFRNRAPGHYFSSSWRLHFVRYSSMVTKHLNKCSIKRTPDHTFIGGCIWKVFQGFRRIEWGQTRCSESRFAVDVYGLLYFLILFLLHLVALVVFLVFVRRLDSGYDVGCSGYVELIGCTSQRHSRFHSVNSK